MQSGTVLRFDTIRGYGFIAPDDGGEDVFVHANDIGELKNQLSSGTRVDYETENGERGPKASTLKIVSRQAPTGPVSLESDDEGCDVLLPQEFTVEVTEKLLQSVPTLTAAQIVQIRRALSEMATLHGWVEA